MNNKKKKLTKGEITAVCILGALIVAVICVGAWLIISNVNNANKAAEESTSTASVSTTVTPTFTHGDNNVATESTTKGEKTTKPSDTRKTDKGEKTPAETAAPAATEAPAPQETTRPSSDKSGKNPKKAEDYTGGPVSKVEPETQQETHSSKKTLTVNGKKVYVGDTITAVINMKSPVVLINYQGFTKYDGNVLKFVSAKSNSGGLINNKDSSVYYNASILSGIDFTSGGSICTITFEVINEGSTTISNTLEVASDLDLKDVGVKNCKLSTEIYD